MSGGAVEGRVDETVLGIVDFPVVRRGYPPHQVAAFVSAAHTEIRRLIAQNRELEKRIAELEAVPTHAPHVPVLPAPRALPAPVAVRATVDPAEREAVLDAARREAAAIVAEAQSRARAELDEVEHRRAAIAASLSTLQHALVRAVDSMGGEPPR
jgi:cell division septum initiation protein DivIVA